MSTFKRDRLIYRVALSIADRKVDARLEYDGHNEEKPSTKEGWWS